MENSDQYRPSNLTLSNEHKTSLSSGYHMAHKKYLMQKAKLKHLFSQLTKEKNDVEQLEKLSFISLYHSLLGDKKDKLHSEKQEVLAAKLSIDSCQNQINSLKQEMAYYKKEMEISDEKIRSNNNTVIKNGVSIQTQIHEINQAIAIGNLTRKALTDSLESLKNAKSWGLFDMFAGGLIVSMIKHSKINNTKNTLEHLNVMLDKFQRQLTNVNSISKSELKIDIHAFAKFADIFLDGIIFDWIVQTKMNKTLATLKATKAESNTILTQLRAEKRRLTAN